MKKYIAHYKINKGICMLIVVFTILVSVLLSKDVNNVQAANVTYYYVDIVNGNDSYDGTSTATAFKTIKKAKDTVRTINANMSNDIVVYIREGIYYLGEDSSTSSGLVFNQSDSGSNGFKIMYANYNGENVSIVGGKRISGWTLDSGNIYKTYVGTSWKFYELFENGVRSVMARTPNTGYIKVEGPVSGDTTNTKFYFKADDLIQDGSDDYAYAQVSISTGIDYGTKIDPISSIDWTNRIITLSYTMNESIYANKRYYVRGAKSFLDQPGEFYLDESTGYLYYYPRTVPIANQTIVAPTTLSAINLYGSSTSSLVQNIEFRGLNISVSNFSKALVDGVGNVRSGLIAFTNASYISFVNCNITNSGYSGVTMNSYSQNNKIINCTIDQVGHHGVYMVGDSVGSGSHASPAESYQNKFNTISGNKITNTGKQLDDGCGINLSQSGDNEISYNEISNTTRSGINLMGRSYSDMIGKTYYGVPVTYDNHWDFLHSRNNNIKFNDISNALTNTQDGGGIYSWSSGKGNIFDNNRVHDFTSSIVGGETFGLYLDDNSDYNTAKNNIFYGVAMGVGAGSCPVYIKGIYNVFTNNIIADNGGGTHDMIFRAYGGVPNHHITLTKNIIYKVGGQQYYNFFDWSSDKVMQSDYNTYYHPSGSDKVILNGSKTWDYWKTVNGNMFDQNSIIADPLFVDRLNHNYTLEPSSPALIKGFININQNEIGMYRNSENIIQAENYDNMMGVSTNGSVLSSCDNNDWVYYKNIDFGSAGINSFYAKLALSAPYAGGNIEIRLDGITGTLIGNLVIEDTGSFDNFDIKSTTITGAIGKHDLYLVFKGGAAICNLDWFNFTAPSISEALLAFNTANADDIGAVITAYAATLGLDLTYYDSLSSTNKNTMHMTLVGKTYTTALDVQADFNLAVANVRPAVAPTINIQPASVNRNIGETATFSVSATVNDGGILSYIWQKSTDNGANWVDVAGAIFASYTTSAIVTSDNLNRYRCVVTNSVNITTASITSNEAILTLNFQEPYLITAKTLIKNETFEQIPAGTTLTANNGTSTYNASAANPLWMTKWNNPGTGNVQKVISLDNSNVLETYRNSGNNNLVTLYDSANTPYADNTLKKDNVVFDFKFKCDSVGSGSTTGRFRLMLNGTTAASNYLAQYVNSAGTGSGDNRVSILNGLVYTPYLARDTWHRIQIHLDTTNNLDKKLVAVYADGVLVPGSTNKPIPTTFTCLTQFSTSAMQKVQLFTGDGVIQVYIDDLMIYEPNAPFYTTNHTLTYGDGSALGGSLTAGQVVKSSISVSNNTFSEKKVKLILAAYKENRMVDFVTDDSTLQMGTKDELLSVSMTITDAMQGCYVKSFVWDDYLNIREIVTPMKYPQ